MSILIRYTIIGDNASAYYGIIINEAYPEARLKLRDIRLLFKTNKNKTHIKKETLKERRKWTK